MRVAAGDFSRVEPGRPVSELEVEDFPAGPKREGGVCMAHRAIRYWPASLRDVFSIVPVKGVYARNAGGSQVQKSTSLIINQGFFL